MKVLIVILTALLQASCATSRVEPATALRKPSARDPLQEPSFVKSDLLQWGAAPPDSFAPILTGRSPYPTQDEAFHALQRSKMYPAISSLRLFACAPGYIDELSKQRVAVDAPVVHCATDLFKGEVKYRIALNYYYHGEKWQLHDPNAAYSAPPWTLPDTNIKRKSRRKDSY